MIIAMCYGLPLMMRFTHFWECRMLRSRLWSLPKRQVSKTLAFARLEKHGAKLTFSTQADDSSSSFRNTHQIRLWGSPGSRIDYPPIEDFTSSPFSKILLNVLTSEGFLLPTPTQAQSWPIALEKRDMISVARTGSGKTCAFLLPAFQQLLEAKAVSMDSEELITYRKHQQPPRVLVLAPTRELAIQIESEAQKFSEACELATTCLYGGVPKKNQVLRLQAGVDVVIATPGRCIDLSDGCSLDLSSVKYLVLDEADRMLDMGFEPQIRSLLGRIPSSRQTLLFSATWPIEVQDLAEKFLTDPIQINIGDRDVLNANKAIDQHIIVMQESEKTNSLIELLENMMASVTEEPKVLPKSIVFVARRSDCDSLVRLLNRLGYASDSLHGDRTQDMRDKAMERFRDGSLRVLVATDVASRGLDVKV
jgi:ATP-dependent RNA helicase DDX5/DBP2